MKLQILIAFFSICTSLIQAQEPGYQTYSANMIIVAKIDGENQEWENNRIMVNLNYKTGNIRIDLKNTDFFSKNSQEIINNDSLTDYTKYTFKGILPIEQIINQNYYLKNKLLGGTCFGK